jgi:hypothetical protein
LVLEVPTENWVITKLGLAHPSEPSMSFERSVVRDGGPGGGTLQQVADAAHPDELPYAWSEAYLRCTYDRS